jgi:ABC-type glycerol-3-phosphate transport system substrate-binding protein
MKRFVAMITLIALGSLALVGCGGPKPDVAIFMMGKNGIPSEFSLKLEQSLKKKLGETPTISLNASPIFSQEKLIIELAAGDNGIMIVAADTFQMIAQQGGVVNLDNLFNPADYPSGVVEVAADPSKPNGPKEKHLYGIPISKAKWMQDEGYQGEELIAFILPRAPHLEQAKQVLKAMASK